MGDLTRSGKNRARFRMLIQLPLKGQHYPFVSHAG